MASTIKVDEIKEKTQGSGITLGHALKNSSGTEIMSAAGVFSSNIDGGTISNATLDSTVTFPVGHVLQTTQYIYNSADSAVTTSATPTKVVDGSGDNYWSHTISDMTAGNDVLVHMNFIANSSRSASTAATGSSFHIYRDSSLIYTTTDDYMFHIDLSPTGSSVGLWTYINLIFLDTGASSTSHTYYTGYSSWASSSTAIRSGSGRAPFVCILQEIKA